METNDNMELAPNEEQAYELALSRAGEAYTRHPDAASYVYDKHVLPALREHMEVTRESLTRIKRRAAKDRMPWAEDNPLRAHAAWAVYTVCDSTAAWMTPGFAAARAYSDIHGS